jgi:hypothetical protein
VTGPASASLVSLGDDVMEPPHASKPESAAMPALDGRESYGWQLQLQVKFGKTRHRWTVFHQR